MYSLEDFDDNQIYCITYQPNYSGKIHILYVGEWFDVLEMWFEIIRTDSLVGEILAERNK